MGREASKGADRPSASPFRLRLGFCFWPRLSPSILRNKPNYLFSNVLRSETYEPSSRGLGVLFPRGPRSRGVNPHPPSDASHGVPLSRRGHLSPSQRTYGLPQQPTPSPGRPTSPPSSGWRDGPSLLPQAGQVISRTVHLRTANCRLFQQGQGPRRSLFGPGSIAVLEPLADLAELPPDTSVASTADAALLGDVPAKELTEPLPVALAPAVCALPGGQSWAASSRCMATSHINHLHAGLG